MKKHSNNHIKIKSFVKKWGLYFIYAAAGFGALIFMLLGICAISFLAYSVHNHVHDFKYIEIMSKSTAGRLGPIGDFIGGVLNPILSFWSLFIFLGAALFQGRQFNKQLSLSRDETLRSQISHSLQEEQKNLEVILNCPFILHKSNSVPNIEKPADIIFGNVHENIVYTLAKLEATANDIAAFAGDTNFSTKLSNKYTDFKSGTVDQDFIEYFDVAGQAEYQFSFFHRLSLDHIRYCPIETINQALFLKHKKYSLLLLRSGVYNCDEYQHVIEEARAAIIRKEGVTPEWMPVES